MNDLRKIALEKRAGELKDANAEKREKILAEIERDLRKEAHRRAMAFDPGNVIY